jgi:hypothetical protein
VKPDLMLQQQMGKQVARLHRVTPPVKTAPGGIVDPPITSPLPRPQQSGHGLSRELARALVEDRVAATVPLTEQEELALTASRAQAEGLTSEAALEQWLTARHWSRDDLQAIATRAERLQRWSRWRFADEVQALADLIAHVVSTFAIQNGSILSFFCGPSAGVRLASLSGDPMVNSPPGIGSRSKVASSAFGTFSVKGFIASAAGSGCLAMSSWMALVVGSSAGLGSGSAACATPTSANGAQSMKRETMSERA